MTRHWLPILLTTAVAFAAACGDETEVAPPSPPRGSASPAGSGSADRSAKAAPSASAAADAGAPDAASPVLTIEFEESDFVESDESRDPFRSFAALFMNQAKARTVVQRKVSASQYALDELKLAGIITRSGPRAMVIDPVGLGWVLQQGDYVGKPELVSTGGPTGVDVALNWRVDRVRDTDVVFLREDPAHPEIPPTTRVMYLYPVEASQLGTTRPR
jgi:type IV pilus assembly protein PilP